MTEVELPFPCMLATRVCAFYTTMRFHFLSCTFSLDFVENFQRWGSHFGFVVNLFPSFESRVVNGASHDPLLCLEFLVGCLNSMRLKLGRSLLSLYLPGVFFSP